MSLLICLILLPSFCTYCLDLRQHLSTVVLRRALPAGSSRSARMMSAQDTAICLSDGNLQVQSYP